MDDIGLAASEMFGRLITVVYWSGWAVVGLSGLIAIIVTLASIGGPDPSVSVIAWFFCGLLTLGWWGFCRICRYVWTGTSNQGE